MLEPNPRAHVGYRKSNGSRMSRWSVGEHLDTAALHIEMLRLPGTMSYSHDMHRTKNMEELVTGLALRLTAIWYVSGPCHFRASKLSPTEA